MTGKELERVDSGPPPIVWPDSHRSEKNVPIELQKGMPINLDAERFILGSILLDDSRFPDVASAIAGEDFGLEKHRRIWRRMLDLQERGGRVDRVTVAEELQRWNELESVDGLTYLISLDDGLPHISNLDAYVKIVRNKSTLRRIAVAGQQLMNRALMAEDDPTDILAGAEEALLGLATNREERGLASPLEIIEETEGGINAFLDPSKRETGIASGFTKFDDMTGGFRPGELTILAARPSMGKSSFALNVAWNVAARLFEPVAFFSLEMSRQSLLTRLLCSAGHVDTYRFRSGYLNQGERDKLRAAARQAIEVPLWIDDSAQTTLMDIRAKVGQMTRRLGRKVRLVIVDYLQLMASKGKSENRNQEVSAMSRGLKLLSKELDCHIIALSQLSRAVETRPGDHRPQLSDLRDSGSIEQDADLVAFLWREEVYKRDREDLKGLAELILAKQRNGSIGSIDLIWLAALTKFENRAQDIGEAPPESGHLPYADN